MDIFENFGHFGQLKNHSKAQKSRKSEVISDRPTDRQTDRQTDIVNYRVALTRLKTRGAGREEQPRERE